MVDFLEAEINWQEGFVFTLVHLLVGWFCQQDYLQIFTKLGWTMGFNPEQIPVTLGAALYKETDPGTLWQSPKLY